MGLGGLLENGIAGGLVVVLYLIISRILTPLVRNALKRHKDGAPVTAAVAADHPRLGALEVKFSAFEAKVDARVIDLEGALRSIGDTTRALDEKIEATSAALDDKMDVMIREMQDMRKEASLRDIQYSDRLARLETNMEHLLDRKLGRQSSGR